MQGRVPGSGGLTRRNKCVLFVLAHQDDEVFASTWIEREAGRGHAVWCVFLTDGREGGADPRRRDAESRRALARLGVPTERILFLGSERGVRDGELPRHLEASLAELSRRFEGQAVQRIFTTAWEGGHQDHDAAHLIALAFARSRGRLARTWQIPLYNGFRRPWRFFRVAHALAGPRRRCSRRLGAGEAWRHALLPAQYPSQWRSWLGLLPGFLIARAVQRRETILSVDLERVRERPHAGPLLYERRTRWTYDAFRTAGTAGDIPLFPSQPTPR